MSQVSQQYLKDKDGNVFSPIVSNESIQWSITERETMDFVI